MKLQGVPKLCFKYNFIMMQYRVLTFFFKRKRQMLNWFNWLKSASLNVEQDEGSESDDSLDDNLDNVRCVCVCY
jgi:hypothetical protein